MSTILQNIFSTEFVYMWIRVVTPILLPALGGAICNRAGVVNLGLEGIMLISALAGVLGGAYGGSLLTGLLAGLGAALLVSLVLASGRDHLRYRREYFRIWVHGFAAIHIDRTEGH